MKKKLFLIGLLLFIAFSVFSQSDGWYSCTINMLGPQTSGRIIYIWLTDINGSFSNKIFKANPDFQKEIYAAALMTFAMDYKVRVLLRIDPGNTYNCYIDRLYVYK